ncbi:MAG: PIN domain-containing protein [Vicinamibacterales bacterium]
MRRRLRHSCRMSRLALNEDAALHYPQIRADLKRRGAMIGANDLFIAAHARALGLIPVTNDTAEFERVLGLKADNWALPPRRSRRR